MTPPLRRIRWGGARRIISTRHPPIDLFEDIADPADWDLIIAEEMKSNPRIAATVGRLDLVPINRRPSGPGASYLLAPFTHVSPERPGRFHDGTFGALYVARKFETAIAEVTHHAAIFLRATREAPGWISQSRELVFSIDRTFHDIRGSGAHEDAMAPDSYAVSQTLGIQLRADNSEGIVYASVRHPGGECLAAFWPDTVGAPTPGRALAFHFDGARIDLVRDESQGTVYRLES